ncbi:MAG TPA: hypothetical protein PLU50_07170 [Pseudobdellovibrionaceae bacterium]|nr:hypothetical protein [Pseudobdellovibrionaceae bacterium]
MIRNIVCTTSVVFLTLFASYSAKAQSQSSGVSFVIHHPYLSARALGMGDAFVGLANDYSAIFYNPAALARRDDSELNLSMEFGASSSFFSFSNDITNASNTTGSDAAKQAAVIRAIEAQYGKTFSVHGSLFNGIIAKPNWSFAVIPADLNVELTMNRLTGPSINTTLYADTTLAYAYAKDVLWIEHARTSAGLTGKFTSRGYFSKAINFLELAYDSNPIKMDDFKEGYAVDFDYGMLITPEIPREGILSYLKHLRPTIGFVARNLMESSFGSSLNLLTKRQNGQPEKNFRVFDLGAKFELPTAFIFGGRLALDVRDMGHPFFNFRKGFHAGFEFDWVMTSWWKGSYRIGVNQGYPTLGLSAMLGIFNLDLATYGEDVGTFNTPQENRVYLLKGSLNF